MHGLLALHGGSFQDSEICQGLGFFFFSHFALLALPGIWTYRPQKGQFILIFMGDKLYTSLKTNFTTER